MGKSYADSHEKLAVFGHVCATGNVKWRTYNGPALLRRTVKAGASTLLKCENKGNHANLGDHF
jgi:hypothetical protein